MMLQNLRAKIGARLNGDREAGFTLIELLVVMLILGILAAIALPAFFNQKSKAGDAKAKETAHSAQVAMETYATDNNGSYLNATTTKLHEIEPTIDNSVTSPVAISGASATAYTITVTAPSENTFSIVNAEGALTYPCTVKSASNRGGCPGTGSANGDWSK
jgi:type IV pilus assembly protein PilA